MRTGSIEVMDLGCDVDYGTATALQESLHAERVAAKRGDVVLLLEHRPVYTLGRSAERGHVLLDGKELERRGIALFPTSRGGDVTYHGPGQLVGYPIVHLSDRGLRVVEYVTAVEEALIRTLADFSIVAGRDPRNRGVWVGNDKVAAIGIRVSRQVAMHGFALNVTTRLEDYCGIVPCGLATAGVTSMACVLGKSVALADVKKAVVSHLQVVLDTREVSL